MKKLINSTGGKYAVNILMAVFFAALAITGLFFMEGGERHEGGHDRNHAGNTENMELSEMIELQGFASFDGIENFKGARGHESGSGEGIHQITGIIWLVLMLVHIWQHWNWYKKMFSPKQILQTKLLTITTILFGLLLITSIGLLTKSFPRGFINLKEIHGFLGQAVLGLVIIHIIQRFKWYVTITQKLFVRTSVPVV